jgi:hypothetical protein
MLQVQPIGMLLSAHLISIEKMDTNLRPRYLSGNPLGTSPFPRELSCLSAHPSLSGTFIVWLCETRTWNTNLSSG